MDVKHPTDRKAEPLIDRRLAALGSLTGRFLFLLCVTTILLYAAATPTELAGISPKDRLLLQPEVIWMLLPSFHLAVIATLLGSMIATIDLIFSLENPYVPDEIPNFFDMFRYQKKEFGYSQVNFGVLSLVPYFSYQILIILAFAYGLWHVYLRFKVELQDPHWELLIINLILSAIIVVRLVDNVGFKVRRTITKRRELKRRRQTEDGKTS